jgi:hypothetical protein
MSGLNSRHKSLKTFVLYDASSDDLLRWSEFVVSFPVQVSVVVGVVVVGSLGAAVIFPVEHHAEVI